MSENHFRCPSHSHIRTVTYLQRLVDILQGSLICKNPMNSSCLLHPLLHFVLALVHKSRFWQGWLNIVWWTRRLDQPPGHSITQQHKQGTIPEMHNTKKTEKMTLSGKTTQGFHLKVKHPVFYLLVLTESMNPSNECGYLYVSFATLLHDNEQ